jgi:uncharacterized protein (DUF1697 family)
VSAGDRDVPRIAALLRGVNVGGANKIAMAELRALVAELGFLNVATHLQSGNVVFSAPGTSPEQAAAAVQAAIRERFGLGIPVLARTAQELARIVARHPLREVASNPSRMLVVFLSTRVDIAHVAELQEQQYAPDRFVAGEREIYVWAPNGVSETKLTYAFWEKQLGGVTATARNWNTVERLRELTATAATAAG